MKYTLAFSFLITVLCVSSSAFAQDESGVEGLPKYEIGGHIGRLLPNQIGGVTEIVPLSGVRVGWRPGERSFVEGGFVMGSGDGASWKNYYVSMRTDLTVQMLTGSMYIGVDATDYSGVGTGKSFVVGGHWGGAILAHIADAVWFRGDMKFGFQPGTNLTITFGLVFRAGG